MSDTLVVDYWRNSPRLVWVCDNEEGGFLGETAFTEADLTSSDLETAESAAAFFAASRSTGVSKDSEGFLWETEKQARTARSACLLAMKTLDRPWPEWAKTAHENGWKPPRGWKP